VATTQDVYVNNPQGIILSLILNANLYNITVITLTNTITQVKCYGGGTGAVALAVTGII
jgi:hypothetical protein